MDTDKIIPTDYAEWHECITVHCGIPLSLEYITERLAALTVMRGLATPWMMKDTMGVLSPKGGGREII
ncbi:MAG: hypothetical protein ACKN9W_17375 [Methylococcus sp.]